MHLPFQTEKKKTCKVVGSSTLKCFVTEFKLLRYSGIIVLSSYATTMHRGGGTIVPPLLHTPLNACNTNRVHNMIIMIYAGSVIPPWTHSRVKHRKFYLLSRL